MRARSGLQATALVLLVALVAVLVAPAELPAVFTTPMRTTWFVNLMLVPAAQLLLVPAYGLLEATFTRARQERLLRVGLSTGLLLAGWGVVDLWSSTPYVVSVWTWLLAATGLLAATVRPASAWVPPTVLGLASITVEYMVYGAHPVSAAMAHTGATTAFLVYTACALVLFLHGRG